MDIEMDVYERRTDRGSLRGEGRDRPMDESGRGGVYDVGDDKKRRGEKKGE